MVTKFVTLHHKKFSPSLSRCGAKIFPLIAMFSSKKEVPVHLKQTISIALVVPLLIEVKFSVVNNEGVLKIQYKSIVKVLAVTTSTTARQVSDIFLKKMLQAGITIPVELVLCEFIDGETREVPPDAR